MNIKALFLPVLVAAGLLTGCNGASQSSQPPSGAAKVAPAPAAPTEVRYVCPMGCEGSESAKPGRCPVCDMELEKKS